jgi:phospholipid transport system substrate-binding protein
MLERRTSLKLLAGSLMAALALPPSPAAAQAAEQASSFIKATGDRLVAVVNGPGSTAEKRRQIGTIVAEAIDVDGVGRFCLGRFWRQASAEQQGTYLTLFREVLITSITAKLGEYRGVRFTMGRARAQDEDQVVSTVVERPNNPPANVEWVVTRPASTPRIIDVIAEGTSLRITQRSDYASYLQRNGNSIDALLGAMKKQVEAYS